jgi:WD40-like Beta Propeller Repeat
LFPPGDDGGPPLSGGAQGDRGGGAVGSGGVGSGGAAPLVSAPLVSAPLVPGRARAGSAGAGSAPVSMGAGTGIDADDDESPNAGNAAGAGAHPIEPPPVCDPCPCNTGPFGEPEPILGLGIGEPSFGPAPSADGLTLFFSAVGVTEDIFFATRSTRANGFSSGTRLAGVNGDDTEEGTPFISADARSLFFFSTRPDPSAPGDRDLWVATRPAGSGPFSEPSLVPDVNTGGLEHLPRLTPDGLTLMFVSGRDSPSLGSNIWQAQRESPAQPFSQAIELPGVNGNARDEGFWLSTDGLTVFFASNRLVQADMDIWVATRSDVNGVFGEAQNLDVVNTSGLELDPALTLDGFELFFTSDRSGTMQLYRSERQCE